MKLSSEILKASIDSAKKAILSQQNADDCWKYEINSHVFMTALFVIALKYANEEIGSEIEEKMKTWLKGHQLKSGGWGLVPHEKMVPTNSVLTYFALRLLGDQPKEEHMLRAKKAILKSGGAEKINTMARFNLALFGIIPWDACMCFPVEIMLLPSWFPFSIYKIAFWIRLSMVPMAVLQALDKRPKFNESFGNSNSEITLHELFLKDPSELKLLPKLSHQSRLGNFLFKATDSFYKFMTPYIPTVIREKAISKAIIFCKERQNGLHGFGSICPPMFNILMMYEALGYDPDHPDRCNAREALNKLIVVRKSEAFCLPMFLPTWDTAYVIATLLDIGDSSSLRSVEKALEYLKPLQILNFRGDWSEMRPHVRPGGWTIYSNNPHYPDTEDTALVISAMHRFNVLTGSKENQEAIARGMEWILGMQSSNGGWAAYGTDNMQTYLHNMPLSTEEAGVLLDHPDVNLTSNIIFAFAGMGHLPCNCQAVRRAVDFVLKNQEANGSWYGRWGINYIYGTKLALCALSAAKLPLDHPSIVKGGAWLLSIQNSDGGWGEGIQSYNPDIKYHVSVSSTASQTAWAVIGLLSVVGAHHPAISAGIRYLIETQGSDGHWVEEEYTGSAFPGLLMLHYAGYSKYFPLQALAQYLNKTQCE